METASKPDNETILDFKICWKLYKANFKTYLKYSLFIFFIQLIVSLIVNIGVVSLLIGVFKVNPFEIVEILIWVIIPTTVLLYALQGAFYGLAYDIMSTGDEFAEFRGAFRYFRKYYWQYTIITLLTSSPAFIIIINLSSLLDISPYNVETILLNSLGGIFIFILLFLWSLVFMMTFPSITAQGSISRSFKENFKILRRNFKRIFLSFGLNFLLFLMPFYIATLLQFIVFPIADSPLRITLMGIALVFGIISYVIAAPLNTLIATRIYNTQNES
ncbi:hypothetical protein DSAG12_03062 [Promethearchaeum syntrophicum]|uniref:Glycerophosphoryl diester phosphodiesterase membrane domain-containing protein n=1 Tax=Promethearchaeum syntrophicum TaxID=2594042 RepID=A0A5B9DEK3_9ARCH|nr:hypothetical protein [Candidatus Prometheoarchaeum syntrophicum]QEE17230.1 hypothetical protein DSAG12_03062 [Candidatus Prometheoarchaeum syntrophicum]